MEKNLNKQQLEERLIEESIIQKNIKNNKESVNDKKGSLCNCCCTKDEPNEGVFKYIKSWRKYLDKESIEHTNDPFKILTNLWAHKNVIRDLEEIRLNPNLISNIRNDLEFYIPQLCTFLIFGLSETVDEFVAFLCKASCASFYFAHRIIWFFMSLDENEIQETHNQKINGIINILLNMFRSTKSNDKLVNLFLSNSSKYLNILDSDDLLFFFKHVIIKSELNQKQIGFWNRSVASTELVNLFDEVDDSIIINDKLSFNEKLDTKTNEDGKVITIPKTIDQISEFYSSTRLSINSIFIKIFPKIGESIKFYENHEQNLDEEIVAKTLNPLNIKIDHFQESLGNDKEKQNLSNIKFEDNNLIPEINMISNKEKENLKTNKNEQLILSTNNKNFNKNEKKDLVIVSTNNDLINSNCRKDVNLNAFNSTLNFYEKLCNLGESITLIKEKEESYIYLKKSLIQVNKKLPANVYLPFIKIRNHCVAHIAVTESRIFKTKNRAPYMIVIECFRPEELSIAFKQKNLQTFIDSNEEYNKRNEIRSNSFGPKNKLKETYKKTKANGEVSKGISYMKIADEDEKGHQTALSLLSAKNDIFNSKPIKVNLLKTKNQIITTENKIIIEEDDEFSISNKYSIDYNNSDEKKSTFIQSKKQTKMTLGSLGDYEFDDELNDEGNFTDTNEDKNLIKRRLVYCSNINVIKRNSKIFRANTDLHNPNSLFSEINSKNNNLEQNFINTEINQAQDILKIEHNEKHDNQNQIDYDLDFKTKPDIKNLHIDKKDSFLLKLNPDERKNLKKNLKELFGESLEETHTKLKQKSPYGKLDSFKIFKILIKTGEDLRQEQFATQLINEINQIFDIEKIDIKLNTYEIISTGSHVGVIEFINDSISIDELKRKTGLSLKNFFEVYYLKENSFSKLQEKDSKANFIKSFAGYCLVCYFLQIKDRHNANILIDRNGFISHIDFGFMLSNAPGKGIEFENAPFKLTNDILELMGGVQSDLFNDFRKLLWKGFNACVKHSNKIIILVEMMFLGHGKSMPCFQKGIFFK